MSIYRASGNKFALRSILALALAVPGPPAAALNGEVSRFKCQGEDGFTIHYADEENGKQASGSGISVDSLNLDNRTIDVIPTGEGKARVEMYNSTAEPPLVATKELDINSLQSGALRFDDEYNGITDGYFIDLRSGRGILTTVMHRHLGRGVVNSGIVILRCWKTGSE